MNNQPWLDISQMPFQWVGGDCVAEPAERRGRDRRSFRALQWVAPCEDGQVPPRSSFRQVRCHDISCGGIAFFCAAPPSTQNMVVVLGTPEEPIYVKVRVCHSATIGDGPQRCYRLGCQFLERLPPPADS